MADKILTLTQESTGDNIYPNVKEENLPTEWVKTLVDKEYLTTNYYNKAYIDNNLYTKAYQDVYFLTKDSAEKTYATITSVNTISKKVDSFDTLAHQTDEDLQQYKAITYTKTDIDDNFISIATALTNEDLDTLKTEGSYYAGGNNTCTNKPSGIDAFGLTIKRVASGYYTQYLTGGNTNTGQVYTRTFTSGAWTSWVKFTQDTQLSAYETKADITNKLKGYEKTLNLGTLTATGNSLLDILSTYFTDNNQCLLAFNSEGFIDTTTNLLSGSMVAFAQGDSDCYILSNGLIYKFNGTTATLISQDKLVSGTNIKSINGNSLLGSGDLTIEGGGSERYIIELASLEFDKKFTLTDEQITMIKTRLNNNEEQLVIFLIKANDIQVNFNIENIFYYKANELSIDVINSTFSFGILGNTIINCEIGLREKYVIFKLIDIPSISNLSLDFNGTAPQALQLNKSFGDTPSFIGQGIYFDTINGKPILHTDNTINEYTIPDTKTISIFGNHSILVSKDSTDTNIDLYNHAIIFNFDYGDNDVMYNVYLNVVSSRNLVVDSLTDLKTLLGNTFTRSCSAASDNLNDHVVAVRETGFIISDLTSISFASAKNLIITDTVTTI